MVYMGSSLAFSDSNIVASPTLAAVNKQKCSIIYFVQVL